MAKGTGRQWGRPRRRSEPTGEIPPAERPAKPLDGPEDVTFPVTSPAEDKHYWWGTGRRKTAVARVRIRPGSGSFTINKRTFEEYFNNGKDRGLVVAPLRAVNMLKAWDVWANVSGGGPTGQAGAVMLGLARAIAKAVPDAEGLLRDRGLLTRDARMSERKKPGQPGARKRFQFSKR